MGVGCVNLPGEYGSLSSLVLNSIVPICALGDDTEVLMKFSVPMAPDIPVEFANAQFVGLGGPCVCDELWTRKKNVKVRG